jgi:hypothetical protein
VETKNWEKMKMIQKGILTASILLLAGNLIVGAQTTNTNNPTEVPKAKEKAPDVLICGTGEPPYYDNIVDDLLDSLTDTNVSAKICEDQPIARSTAEEKAKEAGAGSVLYVSLHVSEQIAYETTLSVQCVSTDGKKLWEEQENGPLMTWSVKSTINIITKKMEKKIQAHVGKPGLPTSK